MRAYSNLLHACLKYSGSNICMNPLFLLVNSGTSESYWLIPSQVLFFVALTTSWRLQVLFYAHSKCVGSCLMLIQNIAGAALFYHVGA